MTCNLCGTQEATIHLTEIVNDQMVEVHLCEACAQEKGTDFKTHFGFGDLMSGLAEIGKAAKGGERRALAKCTDCGMTYEEFGKAGRLGCASCYDSFAKLLLPLIKRIQRSAQHVGKRPSKAGGQTAAAPAASPVQEIRLLEERLRKSVQQEAFEESARLRDEIRRLEEKTRKGKRNKND